MGHNTFYPPELSTHSYRCNQCGFENAAKRPKTSLWARVFLVGEMKPNWGWHVYLYLWMCINSSHPILNMFLNFMTISLKKNMEILNKNIIFLSLRIINEKILPKLQNCPQFETRLGFSFKKIHLLTYRMSTLRYSLSIALLNHVDVQKVFIYLFIHLFLWIIAWYIIHRGFWKCFSFFLVCEFSICKGNWVARV